MANRKERVKKLEAVLTREKLKLKLINGNGKEVEIDNADVIDCFMSVMEAGRQGRKSDHPLLETIYKVDLSYPSDNSLPGLIMALIKSREAYHGRH